MTTIRIPFIRTTTEQADTLMLALQGTPYVLDSSHPRFDEIAAIAADEIDSTDLLEIEQTLVTMINFAQAALDTMRALSERVSVKGGELYFDGDLIDNSLSKHILTMINTGDDTWQAPVSFLEKVQTNPAKHVRKRLYNWISDRGLTLTADGNVIGYKGVQSNDENLSVHSGTNSVFVDGVEHTGHIPNPIGAVMTMPRSEVNNNRDAGCEQGLHVGTYDYARGWGSKVLAVEFNPRDVVAIPEDSGFAKIRTCRYTVLAPADTGPYQGTTYAAAEPEIDDDLYPVISDDEMDEDIEPEDDDTDEIPSLADDADAVVLNVNPFAADYAAISRPSYPPSAADLS